MLIKDSIHDWKGLYPITDAYLEALGNDYVSSDYTFDIYLSYDNYYASSMFPRETTTYTIGGVGLLGAPSLSARVHVYNGDAGYDFIYIGTLPDLEELLFREAFEGTLNAVL